MADHYELQEFLAVEGWILRKLKEWVSSKFDTQT
jgi:hypothetical protein